jgi:hypothetical protein
MSSTGGQGGINSKGGTKASPWPGSYFCFVLLYWQDVGSGPLCVICEFVMKELESRLDSNTTAAEIQAALDKVCSLMPSTITKDVSIS